jgi:L-ribulose-5-phosphate 3-epimerase
MKLGVLVSLEEGPDKALRKVHELEFPTCQVSCWHQELLTPAVAQHLRQAADRYGIEITTIWAGMPGRRVWDFVEGPDTIGIVPTAGRAERIQALKQAADFARMLGVPSITTHVGFLPENLSDPAYLAIVQALRDIALHCQSNGRQFWFETGQETPVTLLRTIQDVGLPNLGVNLDPANLLMYGKANPVDALDILGPYVRDVHAKDGEYPTGGRTLGVEKPLGQGRVNFPLLLARLKGLGYEGALTIEREIRGPQQMADIRAGKAFLESILAGLE